MELSFLTGVANWSVDAPRKISVEHFSIHWSAPGGFQYRTICWLLIDEVGINNPSADVTHEHVISLQIMTEKQKQYYFIFHWAVLP